MTAIPAGFLEATFIWRRVGATRDATISIGYDDTDFTVHPPNLMADQIRTEFVKTGCPGHPNLMVTEWSFLGVSVTKMLEDGPLIGSSMVTTVGLVGSGALPPNCAVLFTKTTTSGGRRNRGRAFVPPVFPVETQVDAGGVIQGSAVTSLNTSWTLFNTGVLAAGYDRVLFHQTPPFAPTQISSMLAQPQLATQRRRMRR